MQRNAYNALCQFKCIQCNETEAENLLQGAILYLKKIKLKIFFQEFRQFCQALSTKQVAAAFKKFDISGDDELDYEEFCQLMNNRDKKKVKKRHEEREKKKEEERLKKEKEENKDSKKRPKTKDKDTEYKIKNELYGI